MRFRAANQDKMYALIQEIAVRKIRFSPKWQCYLSQKTHTKVWRVKVIPCIAIGDVVDPALD
jgi:hypothetical protein